MPFIAIAAILAVFVGGGVTVAADHAHQGDALYSYKTTVNDNLRHEYHVIRASFTGQANADENASFNSDTQLTGSSESQDSGDTSSSTPHGVMLRVRDDASTDAKAADDKAEGSGAVNADGSVHVNIY
jgi:hypothetical protein